jgi:YcxB-like protein
LEVEYELTRDDIYAFRWRANYLAPTARRERLNLYVYLFLIFLLFFFMLPAITGDGFTFSLVHFALLSITFVLMVFFASVFLKRQLRRAILQQVDEEKPGRGQLGRHKISLTETQIVESTDVGESRTSWAGVDRVEQNGDYIFIYTTPHAAYVIPRRAFDSPGQADSFYRLASIKKEAAALTASSSVKARMICQ